ncbi:MAG: class I SAM-dependent methyltransferase [Verrucomicrobia bacterium]|nr:class I SAM-dependent methyltransferase [Verrucomicrobiota bacterium]
MLRSKIYQTDLAYIHHVGFGDFAKRAAPELLRILRQAGIRSGTLVDLACGSGLWAQAAGRAGFNVIGVDQSPEMIRLAKRVAPGARLHRASLYDFDLPPCDAITILGEGLSYLDACRTPQVNPWFGRVAKALRRGGLFLFDVIVRHGPPMNYRVWRAGKDWAVLVEVAEQPAKRCLTRQHTAFRKIGARYRRSEETHVVRLFDRATLARALRRAGFSVRQSRRYGKLRLAPRRMAFIARKRS